MTFTDYQIDRCQHQ